jgi:hypothetical protein
MATKVYLSGGNVIVEQSGQTTLTILQERAKYTVFQPTLSIDGITPPEATTMQFLDLFLDENRTELIADVQNQTGGTYSTLKDLEKYLIFIPRADTTLVTKQAATAENQTTIISQNAEIVTNTESIKEDVRVLEKIKDESKLNNKILRKIYNPQ